MIMVVGKQEENKEGTQEFDDFDDKVEQAGKELIYNPMGTLVEIMSEGAEDDLIGVVWFFSVEVSCKGIAGGSAPPAGTMVKLSLKMKAFHALHIIESGIRCIIYKSKSSGLKYYASYYVYVSTDGVME